MPWPGIHGTLVNSGWHYGRHSHSTFGVGIVEQSAQALASGRGSVRAGQRLAALAMGFTALLRRLDH